MLSLAINTVVYSAAIYFGAKYYHYDIDGFLLCRFHDAMLAASYLQIYFQDNEIIKYVQMKFQKFKDGLVNPIEVVKNNQIIFTDTLDNLLENPPTNDFDYIIYNSNNFSTMKLDKIMFDKMPTPDDFQYDICNLSFIQVILTMSDIPYKIELKTNKYNYYIANNKLNFKFFSYYLYKYYNVSIDMSYNVSIMDHNAKMFSISEKEEIIFEEDDYTIIKNTETNESE